MTSIKMAKTISRETSYKITRLLLISAHILARKSAAMFPSRKICHKITTQSLWRSCLIAMIKFSYLWCTFKSFLMWSTTIVELIRHNTLLNPSSQHYFKPWYKAKISTWRMQGLLIFPKKPDKKKSMITNKTTNTSQIGIEEHAIINSKS